MDRFVRGMLLVLFLCAAVLPGVAQEPAKEPAKEPKKDEAAAVPTQEIVNALNEAFKDKHEQNSIAALEKAVQALKEEKRAAREKAEILRTMQIGLGNPNDRVKLATVNAMGRVGPEAAKPLAKTFKVKAYEKSRELTQAVIDALGLTRDERTAAKELLKIITTHQDWTVRALAGRALANFDKNHASGRTRKNICEKMIQVYEGIQSQASDGRDSDAVRKHSAIQGEFVATLRALTEQEWNSALDWRKWFNKAKRSRWPDPPKDKDKDKGK